MKYNFDEIIDRRDTASIKWNPEEEKDGKLLPMWVADMDFKTAPEIIEDLEKRVKHGIYGYFKLEEDFYQSIINWVKKRHGWNIKKEWIVITPGVVSGLNISVNEFIEKGEGVIVQPPIYPPFYKVIENSEALALNNELIRVDGKYEMNFEELELQAKQAKMLILCSPHNPTGRVWKKLELDKLVDICEKNDLLLISDEVHSDLIIGDNKHIPVASISPEIENNSITFISPSKTFNLAGLSTSIAIISNEDIRKRFVENMERNKIPGTNTFGKLSLQSAYEKGEDWLEELLIYIEENMDYAIKYIEENIPEIKIEKPEGMYLMWLDFRELKRDQARLNKILIEEGRILLNDGSTYGDGGNGFFRLNIACPREILKDGLNRIKKSVEIAKNR